MAYLGFIGTGNMGGALAQAAVKNVEPKEILLSNKTAQKAERLAQQLGCRAVDNLTAARESKFLFLGVKPQMMAGLLEEIGPVLRQRTDRVILVTIAAGLTMERINEMAGGVFPVIRLMPNTPVAVGEGMTAMAVNDLVTKEEAAQFQQAMAASGRIDLLEERLIDAHSAVAGCGPAYVCLLMEALADGGVLCGLPRKKAMEYAAQMIKGTAELYLQTGTHPAEMKDAVCSPAGSTIAGVKALEKAGFRYGAIDAVCAAY